MKIDDDMLREVMLNLNLNSYHTQSYQKPNGLLKEDIGVELNISGGGEYGRELVEDSWTLPCSKSQFLIALVNSSPSISFNNS